MDDTPANLQVMAAMLKDRGYRVRPVPSGKLALFLKNENEVVFVIYCTHHFNFWKPVDKEHY